jgi:hypothetical protein
MPGWGERGPTIKGNPLKSNEETPAVSALRDETLKEIARRELQARRCTCADCMAIHKIVQEPSPADNLKEAKIRP